MAALGCILLLVLPLLGLTLGGMLAGPQGMAWGAGIGLVVALVVVGVASGGLVKASRRR